MGCQAESSQSPTTILAEKIIRRILEIVCLYGFLVHSTRLYKLLVDGRSSREDDQNDAHIVSAAFEQANVDEV